MTKKMSLKKVVGVGWSGQYSDDSLGWLISDFISSDGPSSLDSKQLQSLLGDTGYASSDFYRVKVTIEPIRDKRGKFIVRRTKGRK